MFLITCASYMAWIWSDPRDVASLHCLLSPGLDLLSHSGVTPLTAWSLDGPILETSVLFFLYSVIPVWWMLGGTDWWRKVWNVWGWEINVAFVTVEKVHNQLHLVNSTVTFCISIQCASGALHYLWQTVCLHMPGGKSWVFGSSSSLGSFHLIQG